MDFSKLKPGDWMIGGGTLLFLIAMFLPWFKAEAFGFSSSVNGFEYFLGGIIPLLLLIAVTVVMVLPKLANGVNIPATLGPLYEERFNDEELKQLVAFLESPVYRKYQQLGVEMQRTLAEKLVADTRPTVEPKLRALEQQIADRLRTAQRGAGGSASGAAPAPAPAASRK